MLRLFLVSFIVFFLSCKDGKSPTEFDQTQEKEKYDKFVSELRVSFWNTYKNFILPSDGRKLDASKYLLDSTGKRLSVEKLFKENKLVFRYSFRDCNMCVNKVLDLIKSSSKRFREKIVIISDAYSFRDFVINLNALKYPIPIYCMSGEDINGLGLPIENKNLPFLFVANGDLTTSRFFIPYRELPDEISEYLHLIEKQLLVTDF